MKFIILGTGSFLPFISTSMKGYRKVVISTDDYSDNVPRAKFIKADIRKSRLGEIVKIDPDDMVIFSSENPIDADVIKTNVLPDVKPSHLVVIGKTTDQSLQRTVAIESFEEVGQALVKDLRRRARSLNVLNNIRRVLKDSERVALISYGAPDPDSIASAYALTKIFPANGSRKYEFICTEPTKRPENLALLEMLEIRYNVMEIRDLPRSTILVMTDCQPMFFGQNVGMVDVVIDHHPLKGKVMARVKDVRTNYGSTCSIICDYLDATGITVDRRLATAIYYGLITDTANYTRNVHESEIRAFKFLYRKLDRQLLRSIQLSQMPASSLDAVATAINNKKIEGDVLVSFVGEVQTPEIGAHAADMLILVKEINWAVVALTSCGKLYVFVRTSTPKGDAGKLATECFMRYGSAGGDRSKARAEIPIENIPSDSGTTAEWIRATVLSKLKKPASA